MNEVPSVDLEFKDLNIWAKIGGGLCGRPSMFFFLITSN